MGYDPKEFVNDVDDELKCPICQFVLEDALQAPNCEHSFCKRCITEWLKIQKSCPIDRTELQQTDLKQAPRVLRNFLAKLELTCKFSIYGCQDVVRLEIFASHIAECDFNPSKLIICEKGCGLEMLRNEADKHNCLTELRTLINSQHKQIEELSNSRNEQHIEVGQLRSYVKTLQEEGYESQQRQLQMLQQQIQKMHQQMDTMQKHQQHIYALQHQLASSSSSSSSSSAGTAANCDAANNDDNYCDCDTCETNGTNSGPTSATNSYPRTTCVYLKRTAHWKELPNNKRISNGKLISSNNNGNTTSNSSVLHDNQPPLHSPFNELEHQHRHSHFHPSSSGNGPFFYHSAPISPLDCTLPIHQQLITFYGQVITINVFENETIESVKKKILLKESIPIDQQQLFFAGQQLEDDKSLNFYSICADSSRHLVLRLRDGMKIYVKTLSDKIIEVKVDPNETIEVVKVKIHEQEGISPCDQRLLLEGRNLRNLGTLSDYGIKHRSTLQLDLHLGGPCPICQTQFRQSEDSAANGGDLSEVIPQVRSAGKIAPLSPSSISTSSPGGGGGVGSSSFYSIHSPPMHVGGKLDHH